ncbi:hypothetical protein BGZ58_008083 [Dissophora ornata]|nr:hypothetical protein BGZ58_008083 [Dissophora ornata]
MSSFFNTPTSSSGSNANKSSPSSGGGGGGGGGSGGWGSFLKQGLSTIESKLDMVLDIQVPIPGGASGTLTSFSPHATVLSSSITGASSPKDTPPKRQPQLKMPGRTSDDSNSTENVKEAEDVTTDQSKSGISRSSASILRGSIDESKNGSVGGKDEASVTVDPFTGMIITTPGIKRMSTPPVSGSNSAANGSPAMSAAAAAAAANRERLEQRMRGIFKKTSAESPSAVSTPSTAASRSRAASPSPSIRNSTSAETGDNEVNTDSKPNETENQSNQPVVDEAIAKTKTTPASPTIENIKEKTDEQPPSETVAGDLAVVDSVPEPNMDAVEESDKPVPTEEPPIEESEEASTKVEEAAEQEVQEEITDAIETDHAESAVTPASLDTKDEVVSPASPTEQPYTPVRTAKSTAPNTISEDTASTPQLDKETKEHMPEANSVPAISDENPLKRVVEQREEQLFKIMQEQSSLLEKLRDLEDAKVAEDALKVTKIAGLEKIIETQKKELEVARGSNLTSQPKSIQKTLEEQRALLEEKDEQIRGLLAEGEVLSKKEFKNLTSIKTLRTKNIEFEKIQMDTQKKLDRVVSDHANAQTKLTELTEENKQLNESLKSLHDINQRQNKQMTKMEAELVQHKEEKTNLQHGLDRAWQELEEARKASAELSSQAHAASLEREMKLNEGLNSDIDALKTKHAAIETSLRQDIHELRISLSNREELAGEEEDKLRMEIRSLQARLEQNDNDSYELQEALDEARQPLLRQIEALQNQQGVANRNWDKVEKSLTRRVTEAEEDTTKAQEREKAARDKLDELKSQSATLEARLEALRAADTQLRSEVNASKRALKEKEDETRQAQAELARERVNRERAVEEAKEDAERKLRLQQQLEIDNLKQQLQQSQQRQGSISETDGHLSTTLSAPPRRPSTLLSSPMLTGGPLVMGGLKSSAQAGGSTIRSSFDSITSPTNLDGMPPSLSRSSSSQTISGVGTATSAVSLMSLGGGITGQAVALERLHATVRQLEGQVTFLTEQMRAASKNKEELSDELVRVTMELEELQIQATRVPGLEQELGLLQERHRAALEMLGERTEEVQELKADIADVKEAYRDQINELLGQLEKTRRAKA